ncbi:phospholipase ABHD3-like [Amphiura filiformis]|uniref:phospholipase ABHD3-like n=1 Tax=Amphiura filiformis TaxID=82378 RepID=UPI003B20BD8D
MDRYYRYLQLVKEWPSTAVVLGLGAVYAIYYFAKVVRKPLVTCQNAGLLRFATKHMPILSKPFWPTIWCFEGRLQTVVRALIKTEIAVKYRGERILTSDGGEILLDWIDNDELSNIPRESRPTVIILPGLTGSSSASYALHFADNVKQLGYRCVVFNNRGFGGAQLRTPRTFCAANTEDLHHVVSHIKKLYPDAPLLGVGASIGGIILFNYLAKYGSEAQMVAAMTISVAYDMFESTKNLETPINLLLFNYTLTRGLNQAVRENVSMFEDHFDTLHIMKSRTIKQFDQRMTVKMFGYRDVDHYYSDACLIEKMHKIKVPTLCLSASDDPFSPHRAIPIEEAIKEGENILLVVTPYGGHLGFLEGLLPYDKGYDDRLMSEYVDAVFKFGADELQ